MTPSSSSGRVVWLVTRAYQTFLVLYPARFRTEYEQEMKWLFEQRCLEAYETGGPAGLGRWMLKILTGEARTIYKEVLNVTLDRLVTSRDARRALALGMFFLAGTWLALFGVAAGSGSLPTTGILPAAALVLVNALLVARAILRSEQLEYVAGITAMANTVLIAALLAVGAALGSLPLMAVLVQAVLIGMHARLLWQLRSDVLPELEKGI